jgi:HPt (histidine-containing phosphotransfer) domain-containing protein
VVENSSNRMDLHWNKNLLDLHKLVEVSRGDADRMLRYLNQFQELIPTRTSLLRKYLTNMDRKMIRQTIHQMSPQLHFFGLPDVRDPIERIENEYETIPIEELKSLSLQMIDQLEAAKSEIDRIVQDNF